MAQEGRVFAAKADDLSSIPGTHTTEGENQFLQDVKKIFNPIKL